MQTIDISTGKATCAAYALFLLTACGNSSQQPPQNAAVETPMEARTCESIRAEVIRIASTNGVNIVKIYDPQTLKTEPKKIVCSGRALVGTGQEVKIYYRDYQDADGEWLVEYNERPLD